MKSVSQFSPASFLFQGVRPGATGQTRTTTGATGAGAPTSAPPTDRATLGSNNGVSLADQMKSLTTRVGKASSSWLQQTRQDLGLGSKESKAFAGGYKERGWDVKGPDNRGDFTPQNLDGRPVAFRVKDEATGQMVEKRGFLRKSEEQGSDMFRLDGQKGEFDSKHIHDFAVNNDPKITPEGQKFRDKFEGENWTAKNHKNGFDFSPDRMNGREVAFMQKDPKTGKMVEHRGVLKADPDPKNSAMFQLEGQKGEFNNNYIKEMAVNDSFSKNMAKDGWTLKGPGSANQFAPEVMNGREVAFQVKDEKTGRLVQRRGVVEANPDPNQSAMFKLKGQEGEFNNNYIKEMALNNKFGQEYRDKGWTVKDEHNADQFHARNLHGQTVAFRHPDEHGQMMETMGKVQMFTAVAGLGMSLFSIVGMSGMYNSMMLPEMAMMPMGMGMGMY